MSKWYESKQHTKECTPRKICQCHETSLVRRLRRQSEHKIMNEKIVNVFYCELNKSCLRRMNLLYNWIESSHGSREKTVFNIKMPLIVVYAHTKMLFSGSLSLFIQTDKQNAELKFDRPHPNKWELHWNGLADNIDKQFYCILFDLFFVVIVQLKMIFFLCVNSMMALLPTNFS